MRSSRLFALSVAAMLAIGEVSPLLAAPLNAELEDLLASHPDIRARQKSVAAAEQSIRVAYSGYLPKLDIFGETGPQYIDSPVLKSQGGGTWTWIAEVAGARLTQHVFDGFATPSQVRTARLNLEMAGFTLEGVRQNVLFEGINAYVEVLRQSWLVSLSRDSERTIMRQLNLEDERVQRGSGIAVDVLQAKSRLQLAKERRVGFEGGARGRDVPLHPGLRASARDCDDDGAAAARGAAAGRSRERRPDRSIGNFVYGP